MAEGEREATKRITKTITIHECLKRGCAMRRRSIVGGFKRNILFCGLPLRSDHKPANWRGAAANVETFKTQATMRSNGEDSKIAAANARVADRLCPSRRVAMGIGWVAIVTLILIFALPGRAANELFLRSYPLISGGNFLLENVNGSVRVEGWSRNEVEVRAVKSAFRDQRDLERVRIQVVSVPGQVAVRTLYPEGQGVEVAVQYVVHVPYRVLLGDVETVNGSVVVSGVEGRGDLKSVNGNVEVLDSSGRFSARTTNGDLRLELRKLLDGGPMNVQTVNGSVFLGLPSNARADLQVASMNGNFASELPVVSTRGALATGMFRARLGGGGGEISVRTINGRIRLIRERPTV